MLHHHGRLIARAASLMLALVAVAMTALPAAAHPLGAFSVNRLSRLEVGADRLLVRYILDVAEVPAFQEAQALDVNGDGTLADAELAAYAARRGAGIRDGLRVMVNGAPVALGIDGQTLTLPSGQGGLRTLRLEATFSAPLPADVPVTVEIIDRNEPDRPGWREIVARAGAGRALADTTVPAADASDDLRAYPDDLLASPLNVRQARVTAQPAATMALADSAAAPASARVTDAVGALVAADQLTPMAIALALLLAFGLGAVHALSPGHGKTVVAAYLVGARGTARHAVALGVTVTITHTIGVFALGLVTLFLSQYVLPERLFPWLSAVSGVLVVAIGLGLARARLTDLLRRPRGMARLVPATAPAAAAHHHGDGDWHTHDHDHDHHHQHDDHGHDASHHHTTHSHGWFAAGHDHGPNGHTHQLPERLSWRGLLALGISGGLVPCPSALVVLLGAIALHRVGFGLLLIVAFSAGLAAVLTGIGLLLVMAGRLFARMPVDSRALRLLPVGSALLVTAAGLVLVAQALVEAGILRL